MSFSMSHIPESLAELDAMVGHHLMGILRVVELVANRAEIAKMNGPLTAVANEEISQLLPTLQTAVTEFKSVQRSAANDFHLRLIKSIQERMAILYEQGILQREKEEKERRS